VLGVRHALDPDHLVAVSTIVSQQGGLRRSALVGSFWGLGHSSSLLLAGGALLALKLSIPPAVTAALEAVVALMLMLLGGAAIRSALKGFRLHAHRHTHDGVEHVHVHAHHAGATHVHQHEHVGDFRLRSFLVGIVHGLAGSAGLALLVMSTAPSALAGLFYVGALCAGSFTGMLLLSSLMSLPLTLMASHYAILQLRLQLLAGAGSLVFGLWWCGHHAFGLL